MTQFFAVYDGCGRQGPFDTMEGAAEVLREAARLKGMTSEQSRNFFLHESAVDQVDTHDGNEEHFNVGWLEREESGKESVQPLAFQTWSTKALRNEASEG